MRNPGFLLAARWKDTTADDIANDDVPVSANPRGGDWVVDGFIGVKGDGDEGWSGLAADALLDGRQDSLLELDGVIGVAACRVRLAGFRKDGGEVAQGTPALGVDGEAIDHSADVPAILAFGAETEYVSAGVGEPGGRLLPARLQVGHDGGVASLPVTAAQVIELEPGLMAFEVLAAEIEERDHQAAEVGFVTPDEEGQGGVAAFG